MKLSLLALLAMAGTALASELPSTPGGHPPAPRHMTWPTINNGNQLVAMNILAGCGEDAAQKAADQGRVACTH